MLAAYIPHLEIHIGQRDSRDVLADCRNGLQFRGGVGGEEEGFDLFVEGRLAGVVETEEED